MSRYIRHPPLNERQQGAGIRRLWPGFEVTAVRRRLIARGTVTPTPLTRTYRVRIEYHLGESPKVYVEEPRLVRRPCEPGQPVPHTYYSSIVGRERPCVYYPWVDWTDTKPLAKTIIPWLMCWLADYEVWHATGVWMGGGIDHAGPKIEGAGP